ncbi:hypothetical protein M3936_03570 [Sutcliffiella horikoshii]|uniref:hypothetical protein n=1 Tax=Sutcliffiella horikoshii TaxID=79883 RepID=UPI002040042C|nr:hypothetical protein [Sutcliffiella horikoshii]MCM3616655.1 hypothetical protein [Sutcliffiella horikoshii]
MLKGLVEGLVSADRPYRSKKQTEWEYRNLTNTPYLHGSEYLNELYSATKKKEDHDCILQHLYNHQSVGVLEIESYAKLENKIIERYR